MEEIAKQIINAEFLDNWYRHYYKLEAYLNQNSNDQFSQTEGIDKDLVKWIGIQSKIKNRLPFELKSTLAALKFDFDQKDSLWEYMYQQLASFAKKKGHTHLPSDEEYELLKDWLLRQIQGKKYLSKSRYRKLDLLVVNWDMVITRAQRWEQMYLKLKVFYETFGHCLVPQRWEQDKSLANWVCVQRRMHAINMLRPERERKRNDLKFIWHIQVIYDAQWQHYYQELQRFYQNYGHCRVPGKNKQLTSWIENQRTARKNKVLSAEREQQLNKINFIWSFKDIKRNLWDEKDEQLCAFKQKLG